MSLATPRNLGVWLDLKEREMQELSSRNDGATDLHAGFAERAVSCLADVPCEYDAAEDPDTAARLHRMTEAQVTQSTRPHQPSRLDPVVDWLCRQTMPAWFRVFLRCLIIAGLIFLAAYTLTAFFLICARVGQ